jgi:hypothetical protein
MSIITKPGAGRWRNKNMKSVFWLASITALTLISSTSRLAPAQDIRSDNETDVATQMHEHLGRISTIKSQIIMGNLESSWATWRTSANLRSGSPTMKLPTVCPQISTALSA